MVMIHDKKKAFYENVKELCDGLGKHAIGKSPFPGKIRDIINERLKKGFSFFRGSHGDPGETC